MQVERTGGTLLEVEVGPKVAWKSKEHPLRLDDKLKLTSIPTLMKWQNHTFSHRVDSELEVAADHSAAERIVQEFLSR